MEVTGTTTSKSLLLVLDLLSKDPILFMGMRTRSELKNAINRNMSDGGLDNRTGMADLSLAKAFCDTPNFDSKFMTWDASREPLTVSNPGHARITFV